MMSSFQQQRFLILLSSAVLIIASSSSAADAQQEIIQSIIHRENEALLLSRLDGMEAKLVDQELRLANAANEIVWLKQQISRLDESIVPLLAKAAAVAVAPVNFSPRSCQEALDSGLPEYKDSGMYWIDPDGLGIGDGSIYVYCDMTTGITAVGHNSESTISIPKCPEAGCYSRPIVYTNATIRQLRALAEISSECYQSIQVNCVGAPFTLNNVDYAWWNDINGEKRNFWSGADATAHTCQCGIDGNCIRADLKCNCDANVAVSLSDNGEITLKEILPVTQLNFGKTSYNGGSHTLGKLECVGKSSADLPIPTSCTDLWRIGHVLKGLHPVRKGKKVQLVYCDFSLGQDVKETQIGYVDVKTEPIAFYAQSTKNLTAATADTLIGYDVMKLMNGTAMNVTTGLFTAPRPGTYVFGFSGVDLAGFNDMVINIYKNDQLTKELIGSGGPVGGPANHGTAAIPFVLHLEESDTIRVFIADVNGTLYSDPLRPMTHFTGFLLEEDIFP
ncbi:uncharacterized protein LOC124207112 isoform X2 [Daphnia pulex]|uniref:uncharacterized protein LOC124207112 isoform X2 n=1 Tax=Daphnia pulex TaxID=6669 RepID=UPI001EDD25EF|nr:uncharacterized protein LOC124207112 isoform X2 [Daphnia pulex]